LTGTYSQQSESIAQILQVRVRDIDNISVRVKKTIIPILFTDDGISLVILSP
jgi:hypothetical protein